jgi:hypothetical protein
LVEKFVSDGKATTTVDMHGAIGVDGSPSMQPLMQRGIGIMRLQCRLQPPTKQIPLQLAVTAQRPSSLIPELCLDPPVVRLCLQLPVAQRDVSAGASNRAIPPM